MPPTTTDIRTLVQGFAKHIKELKAPEYKESQVRLHYIDPFWMLLGWDVQNTAQSAPQDVEVVVEPSMDSVDDDGLRSRQPDYLFRVNGFARFVVEAKKPSVDLDADKRAIFQAKRYAWSAAIPFAILTDFEQFRLYDTTLKPILNEPARGRVNEFSLDFQHYPEQWDVLARTFGRDAVAAGSLEALRAKIRKVPAGRRLRTVDRMLIDLRGDEPVDQVFLAYLDTHRQHFAREVYRHNRNFFPDADTLHGAARLTEAVQRLMDRLVFMRVCEDRGIAEWGALRATLQRIGSEGGDLYAALCNEFRELDRAYNGYLFKPHPLTEALEIDANVLADFIRTLYPPDGPWDFSAIADDILGIVYERFLGNVVTVKKHQVEVEEKPEVRHAGGVYYTPRFVVQTIIRRVVGPKVAGKTPAEVLNVKILDPACGSGSFLVAAFQYLIDHCLAAIAADPSLASVPATPKARKKRKDIAFKDRKSDWHLAPDFKAALLTSCLHGVDIDQQAVEVTVMSLYLKMLEGALPPHWQRDWLENELLPPLDNNIQCGNSLIDSADFDRYVVEKYGGLFPMDEDLRFRINRFDWASRTRGFGRLLDSEARKVGARAGFDCIIGNPPYIRVQELNKWAPEECEFYKWKYKSAAKGNYDIYVVFTEKCLSLLAPDGLLGFIMPHKFWQAKYGEGLRKVIADGKHLKAVVDFGDQQVFKGGTTYTAVHVLSRAEPTRQIGVAKVLELDDGVSQCAAIDAGRNSPGVETFAVPNTLTAEPWYFHNSSTRRLLDQIRTGSKLLYPDVCSAVFQGIVTGADPVFLSTGWEPHPKDSALVKFHSDAEDAVVEIERAVTVPVVRRQGFDSYIAEPQQILLLPYDTRFEGLLTAKVMESEFPRAWAYLSRHRATLAAREKGRFSEAWWSLSRAQNIRRWSGSKVLVPYMISRLQAVYDAEGSFFVNVTTGGYGLEVRTDMTAKPWEDAPLYLVGLLNSRLLDHCMRQISNHFHGGYYPANKQYLQHLPIKLPTTAEDKRLAGRIVESVRAIMDAKAKLRAPAPPFSGVKGRLKPAGLSDRETKSLEAEVEAHEKRIDEAVFALYGVDGLPE
jgi:type I restriction-modification system DNA methylase subunit